ncbi:MAG TPA: hypothetical protein VKI44_42360 [Acetobacteraceae bacterium]|nr:hypothetical protein [Acetobacteraceae bacterium]
MDKFDFSVGGGYNYRQTGLPAEGRDTGAAVPEEAPDRFNMPDGFNMPDEGVGAPPSMADETFTGPRAVPTRSCPNRPFRRARRQYRRPRDGAMIVAAAGFG